MGSWTIGPLQHWAKLHRKTGPFGHWTIAPWVHWAVVPGTFIARGNLTPFALYTAGGTIVSYQYLCIAVHWAA